MTSRLRRTVIAGAAPVLLAVAIAAAYAGSLSGGLVYDNRFIIARADRVHDATWANVREIFTTDYWWPFNVHGVYRPLTTLSFLGNWAVLGNAQRPLGYHVVNALLHWLNAVLLLSVARRALGLGAITSLWIALLFALHPVATEAVTNVVGRADLLAATSVLASLLLHVRAQGATSAASRAAWRGAVALAVLAGLLCKESAITAVGAIALYDLVFTLRDGLARSWSERVRRIARHAATAWTPLLPPLVAVAGVRAWIFARTPPWTVGIDLNPLVAVDPLTSRLTALKALGRAFWILLWPATLCPDYSLGEVPLFGWQLTGWEDAQALVVLAAAAIAASAAIALRRRAPAAAFFIGLFFVADLPISNLVFASTTVLAERLLYVPSIGFCGAVVLATEAIARWLLGATAAASARSRSRPIAAAAVGVLLTAVATAYAVRTTRRNLDWRSDLSLWTAAIESCPGSYRAREMLSAALFDPAGDHRGDPARLDRALALQDEAVAILERHAPAGAELPPTAFERLAFLQYRKSRLVEAAGAAGDASGAAAWAARSADSFERAAEGFDRERARRAARAAAGAHVPDVPGPLFFDTFGLAALRAGRPEQAVEAFHRACALAPHDPGVHEHLATAAYRAGGLEDALGSLVRAWLIAGDRADLARAARALAGRLDGGRCPPGEWDPAHGAPDATRCAETRALLCRSYAELLSALSVRQASGDDAGAGVAERTRVAAARVGCAGPLP